MVKISERLTRWAPIRSDSPSRSSAYELSCVGGVCGWCYFAIDADQVIVLSVSRRPHRHLSHSLSCRVALHCMLFIQDLEAFLIASRMLVFRIQQEEWNFLRNPESICNIVRKYEKLASIDLKWNIMFSYFVLIDPYSWLYCVFFFQKKTPSAPGS